MMQTQLYLVNPVVNYSFLLKMHVYSARAQVSRNKNEVGLVRTFNENISQKLFVQNKFQLDHCSSW